jgi:hypothetical protein
LLLLSLPPPLLLFHLLNQKVLIEFMCSVQPNIFVPKNQQNAHHLFFTMAQQPPVGQGLLIVEDSWLHLFYTPQSGGLSSKMQWLLPHNTQHPVRFNQQTQQVTGHRPTPLGSAKLCCNILKTLLCAFSWMNSLHSYDNAHNKTFKTLYELQVKLNLRGLWLYGYCTTLRWSHNLNHYNHNSVTVYNIYTYCACSDLLLLCLFVEDIFFVRVSWFC